MQERTLNVSSHLPILNVWGPKLQDNLFFGFGVAEGEAEGVAEGAMDAEAEADGLALADALGLAEGEALGKAEGEALGEADGDWDGSGLGDPDGSALGEADGEAEGDSLGDADGLGLIEGAGEAVGVSADEDAFWGSETNLKIKSFVLLSVSSPLPPLTSAPEVMLSAVEAEFAFLSALPLASGAVKDVPSPNGFATVPKVTASTIVPVSKAPFLKARLLLFETKSVVFLSQESAESSELLHHKKYP